MNVSQKLMFEGVQIHIVQIRKEPKEASRERAELAKEAAAAKRQALAVKNDGKTKMKGKNRPSKSYRKKKTNIIDDKKVKLSRRKKLVERRPT